MSHIIQPPPIVPTRSEALSLRLTPQEKQKIEQVAEKLGRPVATVARDFLMQAIDLFNKEVAHEQR